jgi:GntR family galactonate operon transcriptional repressor
MFQRASPDPSSVSRDEFGTEKPSLRVVRELALRVIRSRTSLPFLLPTEPVLCEEHKVSRTVLREAVRTLQAKGLVKVTHGQGMVAQPASLWNLLDPEVLNWQCEVGVDKHFVTNLYEVRSIFEPAIASWAARRATDEDIERLERSYQQMSAAITDANAFIRADMEFHRIIAESCGNEILARFSYSIETALRAGREISIKVPTGRDESCAMHEIVLDAIKHRDPEGAAASILVIVRKAFRDIEAVLAQAKVVE